MTSRRFTSKPQCGFTLLELLIAISLLGMLLVLMFGGLRLGMRSWDVLQRQVDNLNSVRALEGFLRRELEQMRPFRWKVATGSTLAFHGNASYMRFVAPLPARIGAGGLYAISLEFERSGSGRRIIWRHTPVSPAMHDFSELVQLDGMVLASKELGVVDDIALSYFGTDLPGQPGQWRDSWEQRASLPQLIRVRVRFSDGSEWPEFVVAPVMASGGVG